MMVQRLTNIERAVVVDFIRLGTLVAVAQARGRSVKTIEKQMHGARAKCGGVSAVQLAILVDRESAVPLPVAEVAQTSRRSFAIEHLSPAEVAELRRVNGLQVSMLMRAVAPMLAEVVAA